MNELTAVAIERHLAGIRVALERIAAALERATADPPASAQSPACQHPLEARIDFGVTNGVEDFECKLCGFRPEIPAVDPAVLASEGVV